MENSDGAQPQDWGAVMTALREMKEGNTELLNRQVACEAMLVAAIRTLDLRGLAALSEQYDAAIDRSVAAMPHHL